jgi:hypothetical protein
VADRFHLVQNVGAALDEVMRSRGRRKEIERVQIETAEPIVVPRFLPSGGWKLTRGTSSPISTTCAMAECRVSVLG